MFVVCFFFVYLFPVSTSFFASSSIFMRASINNLFVTCELVEFSHTQSQSFSSGEEKNKKNTRQNYWTVGHPLEEKGWSGESEM